MKDDADKLLDKPARAVHAAESLLKEGDVEFAAGRAYYAMFYAAEALLHRRGLQFSKHSAVHAAFGKEFARTGSSIRSSIVGCSTHSRSGSRATTASSRISRLTTCRS